MNKIIVVIALIIASLTTVAFAREIFAPLWQIPWNESSDSKVYKQIDKDSGITCYIVQGSKNDVAISCVK